MSVTGSSGSGTTSVRNTFEQIFRREGVEAVFIEGDAFHAFDRAQMRAAEAREPTLSHFGERANLLAELEAVFREYAASGRGRTRHYVHDAEDAARFRAEPGTFTPGRSLRRAPTCCSTRACTGRSSTSASTSPDRPTSGSAWCR